MGKQELKQRETQVATGDGVGKQLFCVVILGLKNVNLNNLSL